MFPKLRAAPALFLAKNSYSWRWRSLGEKAVAASLLLLFFMLVLNQWVMGHGMTTSSTMSWVYDGTSHSLGTEDGHHVAARH